MSELQANPAEAAKRAELNQMLGDPSKDLAYCHNYAYIVTVILSKVGMNRTQNNIEDKGAVQNEISKGQTQFASMQQFMALLEGNTQWDSKKKEAYWPGGFQKAHENDMNNFVNAFGQFFFNKGKGADNSTTTTALNIDYTLPGEFAGYPPGTKVIINPCANKVLVTAPGKAPKIYSGTGTDNPFHYVLSNEQTYIKKVMKYVTGSSTIPANGSTVPQYLATAMASFQSSVDDAPESFFKKCFAHSYEFSSFAGTPNDNPLISSAESLYQRFSETTGTDGVSIATTLDNAYLNGDATDQTQLWNDCNAMMADWMQNKMGNQSSSSGSSAPAGSQYLLPTGAALPPVPPTQAEIDSVVKQLKTYLNEIGGTSPALAGLFIDAIQQVEKKPLTQAELNKAKSDMETVGNIMGGKVKTALDNLGNTIAGLIKYPKAKALNDTGLFNEVQSALSMGASTYQSQTQQNAAAVQQQSSMLTSYDQIGQSIITAMNKAEQTIAGNLKSS